jgi:NADPH:quinone reductase-like Zn-dependent oxidoreductase
MRAVCLNKQGGYEELVFGEISQPRPGSGEVLIQIHATAITPTEFQSFPTFKTRDGNFISTQRRRDAK